MLKNLLKKLQSKKHSQTTQLTLKNSIKATGVGLNSGNKAYLTLRPAKENTGIIFRRVDLPDEPEIPAKIQYMGDTYLFTTLEKNGIKVTSVEHILSAMAGMGIDNAYVDLTGEEVPAMDGSAGPFVFLLQKAEVIIQEAKIKFIRIKQNIHMEEGENWVRLEPYEGLKVALSLDFERSKDQHVFQKVEMDFSKTSYIREVSRARNFALYTQLEKQKKNNHSLGVSLNNTLILGEDRLFNEDGFRYEDELVNHKVLDTIGDLKLLEYPLIGSFRGNNNNHRLNKLLMQKMLADKTAWEIISV